MVSRIVLVLVTLVVAVPLTVVSTRWLAPRFASADPNIHSPITELIDQLETSGFVGAAMITFQPMSSRGGTPLELPRLVSQLESNGFEYQLDGSNLTMEVVATGHCIASRGSLVYDRPTDAGPSGRKNRVVLRVDDKCRLVEISAVNQPLAAL